MNVLAIQGGVSQELLSFMGRVIVHDGSEKELQFLFPKYRDGQVRFVVVILREDGTLNDGRPTMWLRDHPDMDTVRWPLKEQDFVQLRGQTRRQDAEIIAAQLQEAAAKEPTWEQKVRSGMISDRDRLRQSRT